MNISISVKATGHGIGWAKYTVDFSFNMNVEENFLTDNEERERICSRARREAQKKTACDTVTVHTITYKGIDL